MSKEEPSHPLQKPANLLHLIYHRNKNQHHTSLWWKWLSILRRNLSNHLSESSALDKHNQSDYPTLKPATEVFKAASKSKHSNQKHHHHHHHHHHQQQQQQRHLASASQENLHFRIQARESHLLAHVLPKCYVAFRGLASEGRFVALGLVLLGVLADVVKVIGPAKSGERALLAEGNAEVVMIGCDTAAGGAESAVLGDGLVDLGERIERVDEDAAEYAVDSAAKRQAGVMAKDDAASLQAAQAKKSMSKTKKKRKNAIDDLFSGLN